MKTRTGPNAVRGERGHLGRRKFINKQRESILTRVHERKTLPEKGFLRAEKGDHGKEGHGGESKRRGEARTKCSWRLATPGGRGECPRDHQGERSDVTEKILHRPTLMG